MANATRYQVHTRSAHACGVWVVFLEHGGGALGIFKSPVCTYNQAWTFSSSTSNYFSFLSKRSGRRMPPAERSALYFHIFPVDFLSSVFFKPPTCGRRGGLKSGRRSMSTKQAYDFCVDIHWVDVFPVRFLFFLSKSWMFFSGWIGVGS